MRRGERGVGRGKGERQRDAENRGDGQAGGSDRAGGAPGGAFYGEQRTVSRCVRLQHRA